MAIPLGLEPTEMDVPAVLVTVFTGVTVLAPPLVMKAVCDGVDASEGGATDTPTTPTSATTRIDTAIVTIVERRRGRGLAAVPPARCVCLTRRSRSPVVHTDRRILASAMNRNGDPPLAKRSVDGSSDESTLEI
jgi:hypothetical protein